MLAGSTCTRVSLILNRAHPLQRSSMEWIKFASVETACSKEDFFSGVEVWLTRPHVVNRRLLGSVVLQEEAVERGREGGWLGRVREGTGCTGRGREDCDSSSPTGCMPAGITSHSSGGTGQLLPNMEVSPPPTGPPLRCLVRELLPRLRSLPPGREAVVVDSCGMSFCPLNPECSVPIPVSSTPPGPDAIPPGSYKLQYASSSDSTPASISLLVATPLSLSPHEGCSANGITTPTPDWLRTVLLPKVVQWAEESSAGGDRRRREPLVPLEGYCKLYRRLKEKYGPPLIENWPETTDPQKFVYEDIAIATYLLLLWEEERKESGEGRKQSFVDLGCGNGLLVYLLSSEGHPGKGIDLRERKIWRMYGAKTNLEACAITPSDETLFPDSDWLIGNHSDELTPWIPVMAARSSFHTSYFVLPCCPHDFDCKFSRPSTLKSQYRSYLDYVRLIGENMGFVVEEDTLRIPSSKRVCQVGRKRSYPPRDEAHADQRRREFLSERCAKRKCKDLSAQKVQSSSEGEASEMKESAGGELARIPPPGSLRDEDTRGPSAQEGEPFLLQHDNKSEAECLHRSQSDTGSWAAGFKPRSSHEHVRNCSQVDRGVKQHIVWTLARSLLETENWVLLENACTAPEHSEASSPGGACVMEAQGRHWNRGGKLHLAEAVKLFDASTLTHLKQEFGGLQTLLRNHHQIFQVSGGHVQLRDWTDTCHTPRKPPKPRSQKDAQLLTKTKPCWFHDNHPQGCPRAAGDCPYAHGRDDLRDRPDFGIIPDCNLEI